jgi:cell division protein FtsB
VRPLRLRWVFLLTLVGVCLAILWTSYSYELSRMHRLTVLLDRKMTVLVQLQRKLEVLREELEYVGTEEGLAEVARREFNMLRPDERLFWLEYENSRDESLRNSQK